MITWRWQIRVIEEVAHVSQAVILGIEDKRERKMVSAADKG